MAAARRQRRAEVSEEAVAGARVVLGLTVAVGLLGGTIGFAGGSALGLILAPSVVLLVAIARRLRALAGWAGAGMWAILVPMADGEGMIGPLLMIVLCVAIAIGADRLMNLVARDFQAGGEADATQRAGWIEEA